MVMPETRAVSLSWIHPSPFAEAKLENRASDLWQDLYVLPGHVLAHFSESLRHRLLTVRAPFPKDAPLYRRLPALLDDEGILLGRNVLDAPEDWCTHLINKLGWTGNGTLVADTDSWIHQCNDIVASERKTLESSLLPPERLIVRRSKEEREGDIIFGNDTKSEKLRFVRSDHVFVERPSSYQRLQRYTIQAESDGTQTAPLEVSVSVLDPAPVILWGPGYFIENGGKRLGLSLDAFGAWWEEKAAWELSALWRREDGTRASFGVDGSALFNVACVVYHKCGHNPSFFGPGIGGEVSMRHSSGESCELTTRASFGSVLRRRCTGRCQFGAPSTRYMKQHASR
jgi:hypothetical protein